LDKLKRLIAGSERGLKLLRAEVGNLNPEEINDDPSTAPSKRIIRHIPVYEKNKVRVGASAAAAIGLPLLRSKCPHFQSWITQLEQLQSQD